VEDSIISNYVLYRAYNSKIIENEIIKLGYAPNISYKRKRGYQKKENTYQQKYYSTKNKQRVVEMEDKLLMAQQIQEIIYYM
jgi:hypothetical protein